MSPRSARSRRCRTRPARSPTPPARSRDRTPIDRGPLRHEHLQRGRHRDMRPVGSGLTTPHWQRRRRAVSRTASSSTTTACPTARAMSPRSARGDGTENRPAQLANASGSVAGQGRPRRSRSIAIRIRTSSAVASPASPAQASSCTWTMATPSRVEQQLPVSDAADRRQQHMSPA